MTDQAPASQSHSHEPHAPAPVDHGPGHPWLTCLVPMLLFLVVGLLEPSKSGGGLGGSLGIPYERYPVIYAIRVAATLLLLVWAWPSLRGWLGRPTWWPPLVGLGLVVPWVVLATLQHQAGWVAGGTGRAAFNPFDSFGAGSMQLWAYLGLRGLGLVVLVPIIEELFLRGFLLRFVIDEHFWKVPFGILTAASAGACALYAAGSHPSEAVAAVGWFAIVSGIAAATRKPIDCILAHAATNLALGAYVLATGNWWLL
ncbi:MAG: CAAX prenyl protease-related protein [Planctomycetia bacterium]|nr:CAAX prenyl protease-related protein [Planctomycetia bacterium]